MLPSDRRTAPNTQGGLGRALRLPPSGERSAFGFAGHAAEEAKQALQQSVELVPGRRAAPRPGLLQASVDLR
jgi:hypothetical protein